jgi:mono/diheme cytochrome c family protein
MLLVLPACSHSEPDPALAQRLDSPVARQKGRALYLEHCALCHGTNADGHGQRREDLAGKPVDFTSSSWRKSVTPGQVFDIITYGKPGTSMPSWAALDADQRRDLTAYVLSVSRQGP